MQCRCGQRVLIAKLNYLAGKTKNYFRHLLSRTLVMDSKKKQPTKKLGKKQFKNYTLLNGVSITDMSKEQLEAHILQLQQEVEHEREERNYYQLERDKIQLFWEVTKQQLEEKDAILQLKNSEIDEAALTHLAEIKLYKQKMKHIMFECQQHIDEKMKEKMDEKLVLEEEHQVQVNHFEKEMNKLKDEISQLKIDHENAIINHRLQHGEELCSLHQQYQNEIDILKSKEVTEIGNIRHELDLHRKKAIQEIEDKKDAHIEHLIQTHEELFQKMKNYYNDIIKNDILLIKSLKDKMHSFLRKECHYKETVKALQMKNEVLSNSLCNFEQIQDRRRGKLDCKGNKLYSSESVIRNLQRELHKLKLENDSLFTQLQRVKEKDEPWKKSRNDKEIKVQTKKTKKNEDLLIKQNCVNTKDLGFHSSVSNSTKIEMITKKNCVEKCVSLKCTSLTC